MEEGCPGSKPHRKHRCSYGVGGARHKLMAQQGWVREEHRVRERDRERDSGHWPAPLGVRVGGRGESGKCEWLERSLPGWGRPGCSLPRTGLVLEGL